MATYYIDSALGADGNAGTAPGAGSAWATFSRAQSTVVGGDTVNVFPGSGYGGVGNQITLSKSGSPGNYIVYQGNPGGAMPIINGTQNFDTVQVAGSYIQVQGFEIIGPNSSITAAGAWGNATSVINGGGSAVLYKGIGISVPSDPATMNVSANSSNFTLTFATSPITNGIVNGMAVLNMSNNGSIQAATLVTGTSATTVTLSKTATGVVSGNTIQFIAAVHHIRVYGNHIHDFPGSGVSAFCKDYWDIRGNIIHDNALYDPASASGISVYGAIDFDTVAGYHHQVAGNILYSNRNLVANATTFDPSGSTRTTTGTSSAGTTTLNLTSTPGNVRGWQVYDITNPQFIAPFTTVVSVGTNNVTLSQAIATTITAGNTIRFGNFTDGEGVIIDDNQGDQLGNLAYTSRTLVSNNLCYNNGSSGLMAYKSSHVDMTFNTCYLNLTTPFLAGSVSGQAGGNEGEINNLGAIDCNFYNNICQANSASSTTLQNQPPGPSTFANNLVFGGNGTTPPGTGNVNGQSPQFASASIAAATVAFPITDARFQLTTTSPAKNAGSATFTRATDILGNTGLSGAAYDMGAYEFPQSSRGGYIRHRR